MGEGAGRLPDDRRPHRLITRNLDTLQRDTLVALEPEPERPAGDVPGLPRVLGRADPRQALARLVGGEHGGPDLPGLDLRQLQGNILRSYGRHVPATSATSSSRSWTPPAPGPRWRAWSPADGSTPRGDVRRRRSRSDAGMETCLNVGITYAGLQAFGLPKTSLDTFPREFRLGMVARAAELGDVGPSAPKNWIPGLADDRRVHLLVTIHARARSDIDPVSNRVLDAQGCRAFAPVTAEPLDGAFLAGRAASTSATATASPGPASSASTTAGSRSRPPLSPVRRHPSRPSTSLPWA